MKGEVAAHSYTQNTHLQPIFCFLLTDFMEVHSSASARGIEKGHCALKTVNGLHLYSALIQSAVQFMPLIHPFTHTLTHQRRLAAMQGTDQLVRSNRGLGVSLRDTSTRPGWDRTGNPPTARRQVLPPEPYRPWKGIILKKGHVIGNMISSDEL